MNKEENFEFSEEILPSDYADKLRGEREESKEELKEISGGDYKVAYDEYLKKDNNIKKESDEKEELFDRYSGINIERKSFSSDKSKEIEESVNDLIDLAKKKNLLLTQKNKQQGLLYKLGIRKKDSQIDDEYDAVYKDYQEVLNNLISLTGNKKEEIEANYLGGKLEKSDNQEKSSEDEKKAKKAEDFLAEKTKEVDEQIENLEAGKKGSFEKIKALMKDKKFQFVVGLAIAGVAIAAPPTGFISMITFGMHAGFLPAVYATKATALAGMAGGGLIMRGFSAFKDNIKKQGRKEVDLTEQVKKPDTNMILP